MTLEKDVEHYQAGETNSSVLGDESTKDVNRDAEWGKFQFWKTVIKADDTIVSMVILIAHQVPVMVQSDFARNCIKGRQHIEIKIRRRSVPSARSIFDSTREEIQASYSFFQAHDLESRRRSPTLDLVFQKALTSRRRGQRSNDR